VDQEEQEKGKGVGQEASARIGQFRPDFTGRVYRTCVSKPYTFIYCLTSSDFTGDLVGLKVSHDFDEMDEGEAHILTLKDSRILDNEGAFSVTFLC